MKRHEAFKQLRDVLADIVDDPASIRRVVDDAGVATGDISFNGSAQNIWHNVLTEAEKQRAIESLMTVAGAPYKNNERLAQAIRDYAQAENHEPTDTLSTLHSTPNEPSKMIINTGGGSYFAGPVNTAGGNVVGRDQNVTTTNAQGTEDMVKPERFTHTQVAQERQRLIATNEVWPLLAYINTGFDRDANYDFPTSDIQFEELGSAHVYRVTPILRDEKNISSQSVMMSAEKISDQYLLLRNHQIIIGGKFAGKTWLRLYFERYIHITTPEVLPLFLFAPSSFLFQLTDLEITKYLARSVSFTLLLRLLMKADIQPEITLLERVSYSGMIPFLKKYRYDIHNDDSLVFPVPLVSQIGIDRIYADNPVYADIKQRLQGRMRKEKAPSTSFTVTEILGDIERVLKTQRHNRLMVLLDNWGEISAESRASLLEHFLSESFLAELTQRHIYLKFFMPTTPFEMPQSFQKTCTIERPTPTERLHLELYTHS